MPTQKLRIAFATPEYVTESDYDGGLANYLARVTKALAKLGHDVHVVSLSSIDETEFEYEGVIVHRVMLKRGWQLLNTLTRYHLPTTLHWLNLSTQVFRKLKQLNRQKPLHLIQYPNYSFCGVLPILFLRVPHVVRASSYEPAWNEPAGKKQALDNRLAHRLEKLQFSLSRRVYAPSSTLQQMLMSRAGLKDVQLIRSLFYLENGNWDSSIYDRFLNGRKYLLYFGRFQMRKGFHILAQALPRFLEQHPEAYAVLVGRDVTTSLATSMADYAREQCGSFASRLVVLENLPHRKLFPIIAGAKLVALPSLIDNLPNACLEAMGLGKVVIGTTGTSFDELINDGADGFLVAPNDASALTEKLISAWTDPQLVEMGAAAREAMEQFTPDKTVEALLSYYSEVLSESK